MTKILEYDPRRQLTEVYSRVNGYLRPVKNWNDAKRAEFFARKNYKLNQNETINEEKSNDKKV